jgi:hypothetical protein
MNIKQIFCNHIYKEIEQQELYEQREQYGTSIEGLSTYSNFKYFVSKRTCLKCQKSKLVKFRVLQI